MSHLSWDAPKKNMSHLSWDGGSISNILNVRYNRKLYNRKKNTHTHSF